MTKANQPIAVLDSGIGGISVLKELVKLMPNEKFIYFGDFDNAPYGTKTMQEVREITIKNTRMLMEMGAKALVVACNTATGAAVRVLREMYPDFPLVGIEPAVKPAVTEKADPTVLILATPLTLKQEKFEALLSRVATDNAEIICLPCPGLMEIIDEGHVSGEEIDSYLQNLFKDIPKDKIDSVVLGCTHYPHAKEAIVKALGGNVKVYDGGLGTAKEAKRRIELLMLQAPEEQQGSVTFLNCDGHEEKIRIAERFLYDA